MYFLAEQCERRYYEITLKFDKSYIADFYKHLRSDSELPMRNKSTYGVWPKGDVSEIACSGAPGGNEAAAESV